MKTKINQINKILEEQFEEITKVVQVNGSETNTWLRIERIDPDTVEIDFIEEYPGTELHTKNNNIYLDVFVSSAIECVYPEEDVDEQFGDDWNDHLEEEFEKNILNPVHKWIESEVKNV